MEYSEDFYTDGLKTEQDTVAECIYRVKMRSVIFASGSMQYTNLCDPTSRSLRR